MTTPPSNGGDKGNGDHKARRPRGPRKPRPSNPHFMTGPEAIAELEGIMNRNEFYDHVNDERIPCWDREPGERVRVPRDFISQINERALRKLAEPRKPTKMTRIRTRRTQGDEDEGEA